MTKQILSQRAALAAYERAQGAHASAPRGRRQHWHYRMRDAMTELLRAVSAPRTRRKRLPAAGA